MSDIVDTCCSHGGPTDGPGRLRSAAAAAASVVRLASVSTKALTKLPLDFPQAHGIPRQIFTRTTRRYASVSISYGPVCVCVCVCVHVLHARVVALRWRCAGVLWATWTI